MRLHGKGWAFAAAVALVVGVTSTALAIEAFQERFEWGDMSKPTTLTGRVIILDPYDEAVWLNIAVYGGNAESGYFWQKIHPGKNLKFYAANKEIWEQLKSMARLHAGPAAAKEVPPASATTLIEFVAQEVEQNRRVISAVKKLPEIAGDPAKPRGIRTLKEAACQGKDEFDKACYEAKKQLNVAGKGRDATLMQYDVMLPGGKTFISGVTPWSANEDTIGH
jgi:cellobiose-specific phosphotransferase system component IIA